MTHQHTTSSASRPVFFRQLGANLCLSGALAAALGGCATLNPSPSAW